MNNGTNIAQVAIKHSETDYQIITLHEFLKKGTAERTSLVLGKKVEFIDFQGDKISLLEALKAITELIKQLRAEGTLISSMG
ncbi:MAG: hypothetical protein RIG62_09535 [Cyclobacteriaceae bacterium]